MAFVEPTRDASLSLSLTHSMLHQTFLSSSLFSFHPSSSATTPFRSRTSSSSFSSSKAEREAGMEAALRRTAVGAEALWGGQQQQQQQSGFSGDDVAWAGEQSGSLFGDEFSVDDLLDFGEFMETEEKRHGEDGDEEDEEELDCEEEEEAGGRTSNSPSALSYEPPPPTEIDVPADDVAELEWVSRFVDDSYSEYPSCAAVPPPPKPEARLEAKTEDNRQGHAFGIPAAPAEDATCAFSLVPVKAKRSKRLRSAGAAWSSRGAAPFIDLSNSPSSSCSSSSSAPAACLVYDYYAGVGNPNLLPLEADPLAQPEEEPSQKKKRGRKPKLQQPPLPTPTPYAAASSGGGERRCSHCGVQKTPQWRAGPLGPKTLCNACGVRYKSGRLLPEYRPACSPTFVSHIHSNSHRRVLEMRRKKEEHRLVASGAARPSPEPVLAEPVRFGSVGFGSSV